MAEKRYWWLKLKDDFFRQAAIKKLRRSQEGNAYTIVYLKMQLESLRNGGMLAFEGFEDSFVDELSLKIDEKPENVEATVEFLKKHKLLIQLSETESYLPEAVENAGSEGSSAKRMRELRQREASQCDGQASLCYGEKEKEKEIDLEQEREGEYLPPAVSPAPVSAFVLEHGFEKPTVEEVRAFCVAQGLTAMSPDSFHAYYEANGWMMGKAPMKDWKAAAKRWELGEIKGGKRPDKVKTATDYDGEDDFISTLK